ncbi:YdbC family protein [Ihubacter sp. mB4P-1]|uniref:YdbC family protein n=1 Tax=Ihubacter sp. mB4P-1 TaxID=3242370 RepID=UPI00137A7F0B
MPEKSNNITYEIREHIGTISSWDSGWNRELNLISWNGAKPKYDIREWDEEHERMSKGITLHPWEMRNLVDLYLADNSRKAVAEGKAKEAERRARRAEQRRSGDELLVDDVSQSSAENTVLCQTCLDQVNDLNEGGQSQTPFTPEALDETGASEGTPLIEDEGKAEF